MFAESWLMFGRFDWSDTRIMGETNRISSHPAQLLPQQGGLAAALMQSLQTYPQGIAGVLQNLDRKGMSEPVQTWASGRHSTATPDQVRQGLEGTGLIEETAARAGVTCEVAAAAIAAMLPALIRQLAPAGVPGDQFFSRML